MVQRIISSDGCEPCDKCGKRIPVVEANLLWPVPPDPSPTQSDYPDPYAPGTLICCSQECADALIHERLAAGMARRAGPPRICRNCGQAATWLDGIGEWYCSVCEQDVP